MSWRIDVFSTAGAQLGPGPITSAASWQSTARMDRAGSFAFVMPASDSKSSLIEPLRIVRCSAIVGGAWQEIGAGQIERIETQIDDDGAVMLSVSGADLVGLLAKITVDRLYLSGGYTITEPMTPVTLATALNGGLRPGTINTPGGLWTFTVDGTPPVDALVGRWNFESVLQAAISLAGKSQTHFYFAAPRSLVFSATSASSGVRAIQARGEMSSETCAITQLRRVADASEIVTTLIPFGGGNADAKLTTKAATLALPDGFTLFNSTSGLFQYLTNVPARDLYGARYAPVAWNDITPISSTDGDVQAAANLLLQQAIQFLRQHAAPAEFYSLAVAQCSALLRPMQTIRVVWRDPAQNIEIDADLLILEATTEVTADGPQTVGLLVSSVDRWPESDVGAAVSRLSSGQMYEAAPQLNANSYVISYAKPVDDAETATFRFRFDSEVVQLTRLTFDFQLLPLESTVKSVAGTSQTTAAGGATTTAAGGATTTAAGGATTSSSGGATTTAAGGATTSSGGSSHTHTVSNHTHSVPNHQHNIQVTLGASVTYPIGFGAAGTAGGLVSTASGSTFNLPTNSSSGATTTANGGGQTSSSEGSHTHTIGDHTHTIGDHTHTIGNHTHTIGNHTHTIGDHTHDYTPTITASYGIFRDSAGNTFGLTDIEYSVDGSTWYAFSVGVNGFASLGDGWYRVDLTALLQNSTTLRPLSNNNAVRVRRKSTGAIKKAMIEAQLNVRTIIQAIAAL